MSDRNYEDDILNGNENEEPVKEKTGSERIVRICIAAIIVAVVVVAVLASVVISILGGKDNKEETTTIPSDETTTLAEESTTSPLEAYTPGKYTVNIGENGKLNIRKEPNKDAEQLGSVPSGTLLEISEIKYDETADEDSRYWGRTVYLGWDAWVSMKYLANAYSDTVVTPGEITTAPVENTTSETATSAPEQTTAAAEQTTAAPEQTTAASSSGAFATGTYTVNAEPHLNMREDHDVTSLSIAQIPLNSTVTVTDVYHDADSTDPYTKYWGKVTFGGYTGWVAMGYLD